MKLYLLGCFLVAAGLGRAQNVPSSATGDWSHYVRIAGHGLSHESVPSIIAESQRTHVFGIEVDNDVPGRYESYLAPTEKLNAVREAAKAAHAVGNKAFVYIAGLECITAHADKTAHTFFKDHPDWVQRDKNGKPAVFGGGTAFWIAKGDEDVWISPYAPEWRTRFMSLVRQIAQTGIDGVYVDIPYWMTHFEGWENSWASFDRYTVAAFRRQTGIDALHDMKIGDPSDPHFRAWIDFRIATITQFMRDIDTNVKAGNPKCLTIAEIFPGYEDAAPRVGSDVYQLYRVVDVVAHEYQGPSDTIAASRSAFDWVGQMIGMFTFRAFAGPKATWMLNYSWDGEKDVKVPDAMKTMFAAQLTVGANTWDAKGHVMSGSNDEAVRTEAFAWIARHERTFYGTRQPIAPVGVYFSPETRNYTPAAYVPRFRSTMELLLLSHREFQIVTPDTLRSFTGATLLVPGMTLFSKTEVERLKDKPAERRTRSIDPDERLQGFEDRMRDGYASLVAGKASSAVLEKLLNDRAMVLLPANDRVQVHASPFVVSQTAVANGNTHVYLMNLMGIVPKKNLGPQTNHGTSITVSAADARHAFFLPFLGEAREIPMVQANGKRMVQLPDWDRSAVVWFSSAASVKTE